MSGLRYRSRAASSSHSIERQDGGRRGRKSDFIMRFMPCATTPELLAGKHFTGVSILNFSRIRIRMEKGSYDDKETKTRSRTGLRHSSATLDSKGQGENGGASRETKPANAKKIPGSPWQSCGFHRSVDRRRYTLRFRPLPGQNGFFASVCMQTFRRRRGIL